MKLLYNDSEDKNLKNSKMKGTGLHLNKDLEINKKKENYCLIN